MVQVELLHGHHLIGEGDDQRRDQRVEPIGRDDAQHAIEHEAPGRDGLALGREIDHQPADDEEDVDANRPPFGEQATDEAVGLKIEEHLHDVMKHHNPGRQCP